MSATVLNFPSIAVAVQRATVWPWIVECVSATTPGLGQRDICVVQAPMHAAPDAIDFVPAGAQLLRGDVFPATRFEDMHRDLRQRYRAHYRAYLMWRRAHALGKAVAELTPWVDYDACLVDESVERWVSAGLPRYAGD